MTIVSEPVAQIAAAAIAVYILWITVQRLRGRGDDPTISGQVETGTGLTSILLSGTHLVGLGAILIGLLLWPLPQEEPLVASTLVLVVGAHWYFERQERT